MQDLFNLFKNLENTIRIDFVRFNWNLVSVSKNANYNVDKRYILFDINANISFLKRKNNTNYCVRSIYKFLTSFYNIIKIKIQIWEDGNEKDFGNFMCVDVGDDWLF